MADTDQSNDATPSRSWLPSPGCLFAVTLLVILASVCFRFGWRAHRQQARLEYFDQLGGETETEPAKPVWLHDFAVMTVGEERAAGFTELTAVDLGGTQMTNADLQELNRLTSLRELDLHNTQVTDAGLQYVSGLTNLQAIYLSDAQVSDAGLQHLSGLSNLEVLLLGNTQVTDAGLEQLRSLTNLQLLSLHGTQVTDAGADQLQSQLPSVVIGR